MYGTIETPYLAWSTSETDHDKVARTVAGTHQASIRSLSGRQTTMKMTAGISTATVDAPFTPPHKATARAERAAARPRGPGADERDQDPGQHGGRKELADSSPIMLSASGDSA